MDFETLLLAKFLSFAALLAATIMYAELLKHRQRARTHGADRVTFEDEGLRGLVRVFLGDRISSPLD